MTNIHKLHSMGVEKFDVWLSGQEEMVRIYIDPKIGDRIGIIGTLGNAEHHRRTFMGSYGLHRHEARRVISFHKVPPPPKNVKGLSVVMLHHNTYRFNMQGSTGKFGSRIKPFKKVKCPAEWHVATETLIIEVPSYFQLSPGPFKQPKSAPKQSKPKRRLIKETITRTYEEKE